VSALHDRVATLATELTPARVEDIVRELLRQGEDVGGGINAIRLIRHMLGDLVADDTETRWAYEHLKPTLEQVLDQVPSLYFFCGD
jgi:hypothetical protein